MTEQEWLAYTELKPIMFGVLDGRVSDRKLRLFGVACCRRVWDRLSEKCVRNAVEMAERYADGVGNRRALASVRSKLIALQRSKSSTTPLQYDVGRYVLDAKCGAAAQFTAGNAASLGVQEMSVIPGGRFFYSYEKLAAESREQMVLLRDIFGNPFKPKPSIDPAYLRWNDSTVVRLAQQMYDSRDFSSMPILPDALEEAGCTSADILEHCRGPGPHVRGCWVVDLVLGKE